MKTLDLYPIQFYNIEDKHPCWYASLDQSKKRKDAKWKVGVYREEQNDEYVFKIANIIDVVDDCLWNMYTSEEFAIQLISIFRNGGKKAIKEWIKEKIK